MKILNLTKVLKKLKECNYSIEHNDAIVVARSEYKHPSKRPELVYEVRNVELRFKFEIIDLDVDSVINQAISQLTAEEIDQQIKRGEEPDVILAGQKIYQQASALEESGKAWFKLNK